MTAAAVVSAPVNEQRLNRLIAVHLFGFEFAPKCPNWHQEGSGQDWDWSYPKACHGGKCSPYDDSAWDPRKKQLVWHLPDYSRDIEVAWRVVAEMQRRDWLFSIMGTDLRYGAMFGPCMCHAKEKRAAASDMHEKPGVAIVQAALRAIGVEA